jgi:serine/threonine protein kinase
VLDLPYRLGKYTLHRQLGGGGMGRVYLATLEGAGGFEREFAVKVVRPELADSQRAIDLFFREGRALAALNHRNVIQVFELAQEGDQLYLVMEYLRGLDLAQVRARGPLVWTAGAFIASEAARGLASAHALRSADAPNGLVHGDISPSNLMACFDGGVKVLDFGLARPTGGTTRGIRGKVPYLPPEVIVGGAVDHSTDIYGLGVALYELLTGEKLFRADTDAEMMQRVMHDRVAPPSSYVEEIPGSLDALVMSAIARDRTARPRSVEDLADTLDRIVDGRVGAADVASLVGSLAERSAERSRAPLDTATPVGRTQVVPLVEAELATPSRTAVHTQLATPAPDPIAEPLPRGSLSSMSGAAGSRAASTMSPAPGRRRAVIAIVGALAAGGALAAWQLREQRAAVADTQVIPMQSTATVQDPPAPEPLPAVAHDAGAEPTSPPAVEPEVAAAATPAAAKPATRTPPSRPPAKRRRVKATPRTSRTSAEPAGSGSISPGYIANPFEKK